MKLSEHAVVAAELTADNRAEIASWQPRDLVLRIYYSWSRVDGGFAAVVKVPDPVQGVRVLAETAGHGDADGGRPRGLPDAAHDHGAAPARPLPRR
jgi:hypothetical protein